MTNVSVFGRAALAELSRKAGEHPRRRLNRNLHEMHDPVHRLLNAMEPESYVRPHRHLTPPKTETLIALEGSIGIVTFADDGTILETRTLQAGTEACLAELSPEVWHTLLGLSPGSVFFETKAGPYVSPGPRDLASWAPAEGEKDASTLLQTWAKLFTASSHRP